MISASVTREAVASHYDDLDYFYRDVWGDHVHHGLWLRGDETREEAVLQLVDLVAREMQLAAGMRICDIGCGYGAAARVLAARGVEVTGITISPAQFAAANENGEIENPKFILGDWLANHLPNESFDAAYAIESSEHMPDIRGFFSQAHRILRLRGRLVVCAWLSADNPSRTQRRWLLEPICREGRMPSMGTVGDYQSLGENAGFALERFEDVTKGVARTWPAIVRRLAGKLLSNPTYVKFLFNRHAHNRVFALTIFRIWIAYRVGAMRYGIFTFVKT
ncbi:MAG: class I SAM-dependent methyltransferase [Verrucomicrobiota bacterium]|nr:class I SAM-dependent methyltransferase [Verrucomicrobiota bacterium]